MESLTVANQRGFRIVNCVNSVKGKMSMILLLSSRELGHFVDEISGRELTYPG